MFRVCTDSIKTPSRLSPLLVERSSPSSLRFSHNTTCICTRHSTLPYGTVHALLKQHACFCYGWYRSVNKLRLHSHWTVSTTLAAATINNVLYRQSRRSSQRIPHAHVLNVESHTSYRIIDVEHLVASTHPMDACSLTNCFCHRSQPVYRYSQMLLNVERALPRRKP